MSAKVSLGDIVRQSRKCSPKSRKGENETKRSFVTTGKVTAVVAVLLFFAHCPTSPRNGNLIQRRAFAHLPLKNFEVASFLMFTCERVPIAVAEMAIRRIELLERQGRDYSHAELILVHEN
jgi:hypothetical protein